MLYNFVADSFQTENFVANIFQANCDFTWKTAVLRFWAPFGDLGATYDVHLRLIEKRVFDFLLVLIIELLCGGRLTQNFGRRGHPHQPFFFSEN